MKKTRIGTIAVLLLASAALLSSCGDKSTQSEKSSLNFTGYPIKSDTQIQYWMPLDSNLASMVQNFGDSEIGKEVAKKTGVKVKYIHPPIGQEAEKLSLLLSSEDRPDIIANDWYRYPGGPQKALDEKILLPLNDVIDKYAPNLKKYLTDNAETSKIVGTDDKVSYVFPFIRSDDILCINQGVMIRQDWLDELGLSMPKTIDEWHTVLKAFKEKKGASAPLVYVDKYPNMTYFGAFLGAYGLKEDFFVEDGKVVYGPADPKYKEFLTTFAQWFKEGLIESDLPNVDTKKINANMLNGNSGVTFGYAGSVMGQINKSLKEKDPKAHVVPAPYATLKSGEKPQFGQLDSKYCSEGSVGVSATTKNAELVARFLDYGYSEEGNKVYNFGIEGTSYNMVNGYPTYTDLIMKNPNNLTVSQAMSNYICASGSGPFVQRKEYIEQYYSTDEQKQALTTWGETDAKKTILPQITFTSEESEKISSKLTDIKTYMEEHTTTMIMGKEDISSTFDKYVKTLNDYGLSDVLKIYNDAYQRYLKR